MAGMPGMAGMVGGAGLSTIEPGTTGMIERLFEGLRQPSLSTRSHDGGRVGQWWDQIDRSSLLIQPTPHAMGPK